jgi:hypothetical protein
MKSFEVFEMLETKVSLNLICFQILRFDNSFDFENFEKPKINNSLILIFCKYLKLVVKYSIKNTKIKYSPHSTGAFLVVRDLFLTP